MRVLSKAGRLAVLTVVAVTLSDALIRASAAIADQPAATPIAAANAASCAPLCQPGTSTGMTQARENTDVAAALESVQYALSTIADGGTYIWRRRGSPLSGVVQPVSSFRDASGRICRHVTLLLSHGTRNAKSEGVACRLDNGRWNLEG